MAMPTSTQIVSRYLFNSNVPPSDLIDEGLIRPEGQNGDPVTVNADEYMTTGGGRFAGVERFNYIRNFLAGNDAAYPSSGAGLPPGTYTTAELLAAYDLQDNYKLSVQQYYQGVYDADYADRAYVFGSCEFKINDDAIFYVNEDGTREIANICVEPVDDNFDYVSDSMPAQVTNYLTKDQIDPSGIGRQVPIDFAGTVTQRYNFTSEDWYTLDIRNQEAQAAEAVAIATWASNPTYFAGLFGSIVTSLVANDIITYEDFANRYVVYDGKDPNNSNSNLDAEELLNFTEMVPFQGTVIVAGGGNDTLFGTGYVDELLGGSGNDILDGRGGGDHLIGGIGDDTYILDDSEDWVVESWNEGTDLVKTGATHILEGNVENLELTGTDSVDATGNDLDNVIKGNSGNNTLDGKVGSDDMHGGGGDDIYIVDDEGDTAFEEANQGTDQVKASASHTLGSNIENLELTGSDNIDGAGNDLKNVIKGNSEANTLSGGGEDDQLYGRGGDDILAGDAGKDQLWGEAGSDVINGGANDDELYGGGESDQLMGDAGNDYIDGGDGTDLLKGGADFDIYRADGQDVIEDEDGSGRVHLDGTGSLSGGTRKESDPENEYRNGNTLYVLSGSTLVVNGGLTIQNFSNGHLGINLETEPDDEDPPDMDEPEKRVSPLVIDLDGDGVESRAYSRDRYFDHNANGMLESTAWAGGDDGMLVRDLNRDGRITTGRELFGSNTQLGSGQLAAHGFSVLSELDGNQDGVVDANDAAFSELRIWRDANGNGLTEAGELLTLEQAGLMGVRTAWSASTFIDTNNQAHKQVGTAIRTDGTDAAVADIWFSTDASRRINGVPTSAYDDFKLGNLPDAKAFGDLMDLRQKMATDTVLKVLVENFVQQQESPQKNTLLQAMIYQWAGVAELDPASRGPYIDARQLAIVESLVGRPYRNQYTPNDPIPRPEAANLLKAEFNEFAQYVNAQIAMQTKYAGAGFVKGGFASGYSHALVDWQVFKQFAIDLRGQARTDEITEVAAFLKALGVYSPTFRLQTSATFAELSTLYPDIQPLLNGSIALTGTDMADELFGGSAQEFISGKKGDDKLYGQGGDDVYLYRAGDGDDTIFDSSGADQLVFMEGITSDDIALTRDVSGIVVSVNVNGVVSQIRISNMFEGLRGELREGAIESFRFQDGEVWSLEKILSEVRQLPTAGDDTFYGMPSNDTLAGGDGNDNLIGYDGNDTLRGDAGNDILTAGSGDDNLLGGAANDTLEGDGGNDILNGEDGIDLLYGGAGADQLIGGAGNDRLVGGDGDDDYYFNRGHGKDTINDLIGATTIYLTNLTVGEAYLRRDGAVLVIRFSSSPDDEIRLEGFFDATTGLAQAGLKIDAGTGQIWNITPQMLDVEVLKATSTNDVIYGNALANSISGLLGNDVIRAGAGNDTLSGDEGDDSLYGDSGDDEIHGGTGADQLDGGSGQDQLTGDAGNDIYFVDNAFDVVTEAASEGADIIRSSVSFVLPTNVERLELLGEGNIDATGNADANDLAGNQGSNRLEGLAGDDFLSGGSGNDTLLGGSGSDGLDGGYGIDTLTGGTGDDNYTVDDSMDVVVEQVGEGTDVVHAHSDYTLSANIEKLILAEGYGAYQGTGNAGDEIIVGNSFGNRLDGAVGADQLIGGDGDDTYVVDNADDQVVEAANEGSDTVESSIDYILGSTLENLILTGGFNLQGIGNAGDNLLVGNSGNNRLDGGLGGDDMYGGSGDDYFINDSGGDWIYEYAGEGIDTVERRYETNLILSGNVENMILANGIVTGNGNSLNNTVTGNASDNTLGGWDGNDELHGLEGNDSLFGGTGVDRLLGGNGNDYLDGGAGTDHLEGGAGNDVYITDAASDAVVEAADAGTDQVQTTASYTLSANIENLFLMGTNAIDGTGNALDNYISGNSAANLITGGAGVDTIVGGGGNDTLFGGTGDDKYVFDASSGSDAINNVDGGFDGVFFTNGITRERLSFSRNGDDLLITVDAGQTPAVRVLNHFLGGDTAIDYVQPDGGFYLTTAEINQLVAGGGTGGQYDQVIEGTAAGEQLVGNSGKDLIKGLAGDDELFGMGGNDTLQGGDGNDYLAGGNGGGTSSGDDRLEGGAGNDTLAGEDGNDTLIGGSNDDDYIYGGGKDVIDNTGGGFDGVFFNNGVTAAQLAFARDGDNLVITVNGDANSTVSVTNHFLGGDYAIDFVQPASGAMLDTAAINALAGGGGNPPGGNDSDYPSVVTGTAAGEQLLGTSGRDLIKGLGGNDTMFGFGADDKLDGGDGDDYLSGGNGSHSGSGNDILIGGAGVDQLVGEDGNDQMFGGAGNDKYVYGGGADTVDNTGGGTDWVFFNSSSYKVARNRITFHRDGDDLIVRVDADSAKQVRVLKHFLGGEYAIAYVQPDGTNAIPASQFGSLLTPLATGSSVMAMASADGAELQSSSLTSTTAQTDEESQSSEPVGEVQDWRQLVGLADQQTLPAEAMDVVDLSLTCPVLLNPASTIGNFSSDALLELEDYSHHSYHYAIQRERKGVPYYEQSDQRSANRAAVSELNQLIAAMATFQSHDGEAMAAPVHDQSHQMLFSVPLA